MKALDEYFLMVLFVLLLKRVHFLAIFCLIWKEKHSSERVQPKRPDRNSDTIIVRIIDSLKTHFEHHTIY